MNLTSEEQALLDSVERGEWQTVPNFEAGKARYQQYARATIKKDKRVNIRMTSNDLAALEEGIPYQTLIATVLHKYVTGHLREVT